MRKHSGPIVLPDILPERAPRAEPVFVVGDPFEEDEQRFIGRRLLWEDRENAVTMAGVIKSLDEFSAVVGKLEPPLVGRLTLTLHKGTPLYDPEQYAAAHSKPAASENGDGPAAVTPEEARRFSREELRLLREAGIVVEKEAWVPTTVEDVDWIFAKVQQIRAERELLEHQHAERQKQLYSAMRLFDRYDEDVRRILWDALPRKDGEIVRKTVTLPHGTASFRLHGEHLALANERLLLEYLKENPRSMLAPALRVRVYEEFHGEEAAMLLELDEAEPKVEKERLYELAQMLPPTADPATGEVVLMLPPGLERVPAEERFSWR